MRPIVRRTLAAVLGALLAGAPPGALAQDEDMADPPAAPAPKSSPRPSKKPKASNGPKAKPRGKTAASKAAKAHALNTAELAALDSALADYLKEQKVQPLVLEEAADDEALVAAMQTLDTSLDAQLKKAGKQPLTAEVTNTGQGLATIVDDLATQQRDAPASAEPAPEATPAPDGEPSTPAPEATPIATLPRGGGGDPATPDAAGDPPASEPAPTAPAAVVPTVIADAPVSKSARYVLARVTVSKDGGAEQDVPIPQGGSIRPIPLAHRGGIPAVELKLVLKLPESIDLGESTAIAAQANIVAPGAAAELLLADELVDSVRATPEAGGVTAAGQVSYSFLKRVGGVFGYQQTFAQGDGRSTPTLPSRTLLLNWTDRESAIELPFAWTATAPSPVSIRGRAIYTPAARP